MVLAPFPCFGLGRRWRRKVSSARKKEQDSTNYGERLENVSKRVLVLCVDKDNDLGKRGGLKTPILGRAENITSGVVIGLRASEKANANAMFEAVRIYDDLVEQTGEDAMIQIATISGSEKVEWADRKIIREFTEVLKAFPAARVILVTDGSTDEAVWPIIQSRIPIDSVRKVVVRQESVKADEIYQLLKSVEKYTRPPTLWQKIKSEILSGIIGWIIASVLGIILLLVLALEWYT